jgi:hypothetical protein
MKPFSFLVLSLYGMPVAFADTYGVPFDNVTIELTPGKLLLLLGAVGLLMSLVAGRKMSWLLSVLAAVLSIGALVTFFPVKALSIVFVAYSVATFFALVASGCAAQKKWLWHAVCTIVYVVITAAIMLT